MEADTVRFFSTPTPLASNSLAAYEGILRDTVAFSHESGEYDQPIELTMTADPASSIYYTMDGSIPGPQDSLYHQTIQIDQTSVIRAVAIQSGYLSQHHSTHAYLIQDDSDLPTLSLVTDPYHLWDQDSGIYVLGNDYEVDNPNFGANFWEDWERPVYLTFLDEAGQLQYESGAGMKIFGGWSRAADQRSFSIFARSRYGDEPFEFALFPDRPYESFEAFILRNSGNDWRRTMLRDGVLTGLMKESDVDIQAFRPTRVFLNGEYWGFYNMREKINEHYLASLHDVNPDSIDLLEGGGRTIHGDNSEYQGILNYLQSVELSDSSRYEVVARQIDLDNYLQYQAAQIYFDNTDWPGNNIKFWKSNGGKWRWILYDTDFGFGTWDPGKVSNNTLAFALEADGPGWPNPPWATFLFRKLTENEGFRHAFINQYADELNSRFLPDRVIERIDSLASNIRNEMPRHQSRWTGNMSQWNDRIAEMRTFARQRPSHARGHIQRTFQLPGMHPIVVEIPEPEGGMIELNSLVLKEKMWEGIYYETVPIRLKAVPRPGYQFDRWSGDVNSDAAEIYLGLQQATHLLAHFSPDTTSGGIPPIVINEINYRSAESFDTGDWVELTNASDVTYDLSSWVLRDEKEENGLLIPEGTFLAPNEYLIVCRDTQRFDLLLPQLDRRIGNMDFGLSSSGETIFLFDDQGQLVDFVPYESSSPWPESPNGSGASLALRSPLLDNGLPESWMADPEGGTPAAANMLESLPERPVSAVPLLFPNPFQEILYIRTEGLGFTELRLELISTLGQKVFEHQEAYFIPETKKLMLRPGQLEKGWYVLRIFTNQGVYNLPVVRN